jgi:acyl-lipid omega-6 desaturase (Delta-12 desaturase)
VDAAYNTPPSEAELASDIQEIARHCARYREAQPRRAAFQLVTTLLLFALLCAVMLGAAAYEWWLALPLAVPAGGLLVRLFIIQHDCGHGSFFGTRAANDRVGHLLSILTVTPYDSWKRAHALHHAGTGNLNRRGVGDITTLTVREYLALSPWQRLRYRLYRNLFILIVLGSPANFLILQRFPSGMGLPWRTAWKDVMALNAAMLVVYGALGMLLGYVALAVFIPIICVAAWIGGWLFFVQHQYEDTVWDGADDWNFHAAALGGSSYYVLPPVLQWFTGNVGLHHVHHLNSRIPNYRLQECIDDHPFLGDVGRLTFRKSLGCVRLALWDENLRKLVGFSQARAESV